MTTQEKIAVMQHFANGGSIEIQDNCEKTWAEWVDGDNEPIWDWHGNSYRIKQEPYKEEFLITKKEGTYSGSDNEGWSAFQDKFLELKSSMMYKITVEEVF